MTRHSNMTEEQQAFLIAFFPEYRQAQALTQGKGAAFQAFWAKVRQGFLEKWPVEPTAGEIQDAGGEQAAVVTAEVERKAVRR